MRTFELLGKTYCVRFDTDKAPITVDAQGKALAPRNIPRRGVNCTIFEGDSFDGVSVASYRSECSRRDVFDGNVGEKVSFNKAFDILTKKLLKPIKAQIEKQVMSRTIGQMIASKAAQKVELASPKMDGGNSVVSVSGASKVTRKAPRKAPAYKIL